MAQEKTQCERFLLMRRWLNAIFALICFIPQPTEAARNRYSYEEDKSVVLREILDSIEQLRHEVSNHEVEIRMYEEKFKNQEDILDTLRQQTADALKTVKEALKNQTASVESKLTAQENATKGLSNDSLSLLSEYKNRIIELERAIEVQNRNLSNLQTAMRSLTEVLQGKENSPSNDSLGNTRIYKVKAGDSLEKIAKQNNTTIKKIKEINNLTRDQIIVGQKLQLPE